MFLVDMVPESRTLPDAARQDNSASIRGRIAPLPKSFGRDPAAVKSGPKETGRG